RSSLDVAAEPAKVRAEVERRAQQQRQAHGSTGRTYLLLLVRPDGVNRYYQLHSALRGMEVDFGYELVDAGWKLEFPEQGAPAAARVVQGPRPVAQPVQGAPPAQGWRPGRRGP